MFHLSKLLKKISHCAYIASAIFFAEENAVCLGICFGNCRLPRLIQRAAKPCQKPWIIKCHSSSSPTPVKSPRNSMRYNCEMICSSLRRPKTIQEKRKKATFLQVINNPIIYKFFKDFNNHRKKANRQQFFAVDLLQDS